jgi:hypothetical protein
MGDGGLISRLKLLLRWLVFGAILFFLVSTLKIHWQEIRTLQIKPQSYGFLLGALGVTLGAHCWAGWVWGWILAGLNHPVPQSWAMQVYIKTNVAKYLPGNIWHFYDRIRTSQAVGIPALGAILSVVLESLLMAAVALVFGLGSRFASGWGLLGVLAVLLAIHPRCLNPLLQRLSQGKARSWQRFQQANPSQQANPFQQAKSKSETIPKTPAPEPSAPLPAPLAAPTIHSPLQLQSYPLQPLVGEMGFLLLRSLGFLLTVYALHPLPWNQVLPLVSGFSLAWLLGLIVPGAPGGLGVFEMVSIILLEGSMTTPLIVGAVALYRLISTLAEAIGAGLAYGTAVNTRN